MAMSETTEAAPAEKKMPAGHGSPEEHEHPSENEYPFVAHHFDTPAQQLEAGKLGIWLFLVTEILFFAGLFCAYTIYRARYPEVFYWAHFYLNTKLGAVNTLVLIFSSLTAAWAVRNAQLGQQRLLVINIVVTIACALTFLGVKYVEYSHKFHAGLLPGPAFHPDEELWENEDFKHKHPESARAMEQLLAELDAHRAKLKAAAAGEKPEANAAPVAAKPAAGEQAAPKEEPDTATGKDDQKGGKEDPAAPEADANEAGGTGKAAEAGVTEPAQDDAAAAPQVAETEGQGATQLDAAREAGAADAANPDKETTNAQPPQQAGMAAATTPAAEPPGPVSEDIFLADAIRKLSPEARAPLVEAGVIKTHPGEGAQLARPTRAPVFFSIYFFMTGLHGLHVLVGIGIWIWLLLRALKGQFGPLYFGPIDFAALYWHLVDMIWIYLFPLLYLIH